MLKPRWKEILKKITIWNNYGVIVKKSTNKSTQENLYNFNKRIKSLFRGFK